jgi:hypothetical protein
MASYKPKPKSKVGTPQPNTLRHMKNEKKNEKHYRIELTALGKKETTGWDGFDEANAFFSTDAKPATAEFIKATEKAIDRTFEQESRWWLDYTIGKLFVQDGWEKVSPMSPEWEYRTPTTMSHAVWKEV